MLFNQLLHSVSLETQPTWVGSPGDLHQAGSLGPPLGLTAERHSVPLVSGERKTIQSYFMHVRDAFELFENLKNTTKCLSTEKSTPDSEIGHLFSRSWDTAGDKAKATSRNLIWSIVLSCPQEQGCTQQSGSRTQLCHKGGGPGWPVSSEPPSHPAQAWDEAGAGQPARRALHTCTGRDTTWSPGPHCVVLGSSHKSQGRRSQSCPGEEDAS